MLIPLPLKTSNSKNVITHWGLAMYVYAPTSLVIIGFVNSGTMDY